jgi:hypothetical protein
MVCRAIGALGNDGNVPVLEEIYRLYQAEVYSDRSSFHDAVQQLKGPNAAALRKRLRAEHDLSDPDPGFEDIPDKK